MIELKKMIILMLISSVMLIATDSFAEQSEKEKSRDKARCEKLLKLLDEDLKAVKADIIADAGPISHATALLAGATISYQFGRFAGCIDKTTRGRARVAPYIKKSK